MRRRYPLPSRLEGLGKRRKFPLWGPEQSPGRKWVLVHFELEKTTFGNNRFVSLDIFVTHI